MGQLQPLYVIVGHAKQIQVYYIYTLNIYSFLLIKRIYNKENCVSMPSLCHFTGINGMYKSNFYRVSRLYIFLFMKLNNYELCMVFWTIFSPPLHGTYFSITYPLSYLLYMLTVCLEQSGVGCHIGGHFVGALAYADDVTLVTGYTIRSGIRTLINVCEQFALDYDITFNATKSQPMFLKVDFLMFLLVAFM